MTVPAEYLAWAPSESPWTPWVKPVLFAHLSAARPVVVNTDIPTTWAPDPSERFALIVDAPGTEAVDIGLALAVRGYRPIPLFNGCPGESQPAVDVAALIGALIAGAARLSAIAIPADAPPAFLLDSRRMPREPSPGQFDNRWVTVPQDFPSGLRLRSAGIDHVLVVRTTVHEDLDHVLLRWQQAGLHLSEYADAVRRLLTPQRPRAFRSLLARMLVMAGLRRSSGGGFGAIVPVPSQGGHG